SVEDFIKIGSPLKVTPPVKGKGNREKLWNLLNNGKISFVASDHAPCPEAEKNTGSIWTDYSGIPGTETLLPYLFSEGYMRGRLSWRRFVEAISSEAAKYYGLYYRKGSIEVGKDADLVLIDPQKRWVVEGNKFLSKGKITPFEGMEFKGRIVKTIVRGRVVYDEKDGISVEPGYGIFLKRKG
ncbi:MAG TPA: allantoinase, partial [candidate division WOR-3 bacterium]|nr:allantoinase [candidate division WOR-3 bacterium]